jgi:hypothetical protein
MPDKYWLWGSCSMSLNPNLTLDWIKKYPTKIWDWGSNGISNNPNITMKWLIQYHDKEWDYSKINSTKKKYLIKKQRIFSSI